MGNRGIELGLACLVLRPQIVFHRIFTGLNLLSLFHLHRLFGGLMRFRFRQVLLALPAALPLLVGLDAQHLAAMPPPTPEMVKQYKKDGSWEKRLAAAKALGNHKADPALVQNAQRRLQKMADAQGVQLSASTHFTPPSGQRGMPTTGTPKMLILMIDFSDFPADSVNTATAVNARVFGDGDGIQAAPYESLKSYYYRSSYGQLTIQGNVLGWYRPSYTRASMAVSGSA